jgi:7-cyano-7-deazaguanine synthase
MRGIVTLVSGGLDSTLMAVMAKEQGLLQYPLFVNYGQLCRARELKACLRAHRSHGLPTPAVMTLSGFGRLVPSGITNRRLRLREDAFLPGRNLLLLLAGAAFARSKHAESVCIGLLTEDNALFPDQKASFLTQAESLLRTATLSDVRVVAPLMDFDKRAVIDLAKTRGLDRTYSCHAGGPHPCRKCVSCVERLAAEPRKRR